jgi:hypothetical protein
VDARIGVEAEPACQGLLSVTGQLFGRRLPAVQVEADRGLASRYQGELSAAALEQRALERGSEVFDRFDPDDPSCHLDGDFLCAPGGRSPVQSTPAIEGKIGKGHGPQSATRHRHS